LPDVPEREMHGTLPRCRRREEEKAEEAQGQEAQEEVKATNEIVVRAERTAANSLQGGKATSASNYFHDVHGNAKCDCGRADYGQKSSRGKPRPAHSSHTQCANT
jgi:hypothetical protein